MSIDIEIYRFAQGTPEWFRARLGIPTASEFSCVLAGQETQKRRNYLLRLLGERITGEMAERYTNEHIERGRVMEDEARSAYELVADTDIIEVGFIRNRTLSAGASPDGMVGSGGLLEIKTKLPHLHLEVLERGEVPAEHRAQIYGQLLVTGREWCDFVSYWPGLPLFVKRVERCEKWDVKITQALELFNSELAELERKYRRQE